ncbi:unnamed protein product [Oikopleura dioica]|uniref:Uncharacterized protein n=1 Tax=Oikopleura dioica TaxID=34765 RepID=E4X1T7_OIKDI|nr:unnamed protein product [Oikopleura dioica]
MKISPLLVTAVVGKPSEEGIAPRFSVSRTIGQCGGSFIGETEVDIKSLASQASTNTISTAFGLFNTIAQKASP